MKKPETVTDDKGNIYIVPGQMTRQEAEVYFPNQPERLNPETCDHSGINIMQKIDEMSQMCMKCDSVFTRCESLIS